MFKRSGASYSLWPEQRPRRGRPLKFAIGSFVLGAVCATAYGTLFNFAGPATGQGLNAQRVVEPVPIVIAREAPEEGAVPVPPPKPVEIASRPSRPRATTAKVTLPLIGTPSPRPPAATDGRGDDGLTGEVRLTGPESTSEDVPGLLGGDREPSREPVQDIPAKKAESAVKPKAAESAAVVPLPRAAPPKTVALEESEPSISRAPETKEPAREPKVTQAPAGKTEQAATTEPRTTRRGVIVVAKREEPTRSAGDDDASVRKPSAQSKESKAAKSSTTETERRGYVVLKKKREQSVRTTRGDDAPARKTVARTTKAKKVKTASVSKRRAKTFKNVARKKSERSRRYAARSRSERRTTTRQTPRRRQDRLSSMIAQATRAYRAFTAGQSFAMPSRF